MFLGKNIIFSGPSGSGKTTILNYLIHKIPILSYSISCTTRIPRFNEINGKEYYFINQKKFLKYVILNKFIEWQEVYPTIYYGTLKNELYRIWNNKKHIIFDLDVKGAINLKKQYPYQTLIIFIKTKSYYELNLRLKNRNTENIENLFFRLQKSFLELKYSYYFDYILYNDNLEIFKKQALNKILKFII